jgi:hypothetical protein
LTYTGSFAGADSVTAMPYAGSGAQTSTSAPSLASNTVNVTWMAGPHFTFLTLNSSPTATSIGQSIAVVAALADLSAQPAAVIPGQSVTLSMGSSSCAATTDASGHATCNLTPTQAGTGTLSARFAGSSAFLPATASTAFNVVAAASPPPTVTIAVNPTAVAAGTTATLTWSSTNAAACTASGAWSGTETASGTQTVTPPSTGNYSYTLACSGSGGSASATAVLSATLVAVTVTAHSGGGALTWPWLLVLGTLVMLRFRASIAGLERVRHVSVKSFAGIAMCLTLLMGSGVGRADQLASSETTAGGASMSWFDPLYVGIRFGSMATRLNAQTLDSALADAGYPGVDASTRTSAPAGTVYLGYELASHADVEFGYTHRSANVATLNGTVPSASNITSLLQNTTELIRGYGNVFSLSFRPRIEIAPKFMLDPRIGGFVWDTKVSAQASGFRVDDTHQGGGVTVGAGVAYRVWRGLELGAGADFYRGFPHNIGTLYSGTIEWRFGH